MGVLVRHAYTPIKTAARANCDGNWQVRTSLIQWQVPWARRVRGGMRNLGEIVVGGEEQHRCMGGGCVCVRAVVAYALVYTNV
jgi:hypothetical protein